MKTLYITFQSGEEIHLPLAYQHLVQSMLYSCWVTELPNFHDGYTDDKKQNLKLFCFGRLKGKYQIKETEIVFQSPVTLELRSPLNIIVDSAIKNLLAKPQRRLGSNSLSVTDLHTEERLLFPSSALIRTQSPITVHETMKDGRTIYFSPKDPEWQKRLTLNLSSKLNALQINTSDPFSIEPEGDTFRKQVSQFKGTYITGYTGSFRITTTPQAMAILYYCGLGNRNSQGFGMFDILD